MNNARIFRLLLIAGLLPTAACTHNALEQPAPAPSCIADSAEAISFSRNIIPIFTQHCALPDCHSGSSPEGNLNLEADVAYAQLTRPGRWYMDTTDPKGSLLYSQMISVTDPMPPTGKLDDCTIRTVLKWIEQKAQNN